VSPVEFVDVEPDDQELSAVMLAGGERVPVWFRASVPLVAERADPLVPVGLLAAMRTRVPLVLPRPVSPTLLRNLPQVQDILHAFSDGELSQVPVEAEAAADVPAPAGRGRGAFFSGGVDAFYTVLENEPDLTHLLFLQGFDVWDPASARAEVAARTARDVAAALGKQLIEIETNVREVCRRFGTRTTAWGLGLACTALLLQDRLERMLVAGTDTYATLVPWSNHPLLDPLWSTEALELVHDGAEATRAEKVDRIARSDVALRHLRVCVRQEIEQNCGVCEKCVRTMTTLRLVGALDRCETFPRTVDARTMARIRIANLHAGLYARENLRLAREVGDWPVYAAMLWALRPRPWSGLRWRVRGAIRRALGRDPG